MTTKQGAKPRTTIAKPTAKRVKSTPKRAKPGAKRVKPGAKRAKPPAKRAKLDADRVKSGGKRNTRAKPPAKRARLDAKPPAKRARLDAKRAAPNAMPASASRFAPLGRFVSTSSAGSWRPPWGDLFGRPTYLSEFLGRLWALFGPPHGGEGDKGFEYVFEDRVTQTVVTAYSGASGPGFGTERGARSEAVDALQALINTTEPVDCRFTVDYGHSEVGIASGEHFYVYDGAPNGDDFAD